MLNYYIDWSFRRYQIIILSFKTMNHHLTLNCIVWKKSRNFLYFLLMGLAAHSHKFWKINFSLVQIFFNCKSIGMILFKFAIDEIDFLRGPFVKIRGFLCLSNRADNFFLNSRNRKPWLFGKFKTESLLFLIVRQQEINYIYNLGGKIIFLLLKNKQFF